MADPLAAPSTSPNLAGARSRLGEIANRAMRERGLEAEFSPPALAQLAGIGGPAEAPPGTRDLRALLWCSIDNDDSRDLDQLTVAEPLAEGVTKVFVAIADVSALVPIATPLDARARRNTTSVYTAGGIFPMLPEKLSTNLTSLNLESSRLAIVVAMTFDPKGARLEASVATALVCNHAKLAYSRVGPWLEQPGPPPPEVAAVAGLAENLLVQHRLAQALRARRHMRGALSLQTIEARPVFVGDALVDLQADESNAAKNLIEELMVAANGAVAEFLAARRFPSIRRVVQTPQKWDRIVDLAAQHGSTLPRVPDGPSLEAFLVLARRNSPDDFPDLSLSVIKLLGAGEYTVALPGETVAGHFGLAVSFYAHSTAPNRRFPDLLIQRLAKAALAGEPVPYATDELQALARHCTERETDAKKIERQVAKSAAAMLLAPRVGEIFPALVTGASDRGTWVRLARRPVEGKLVDPTGHEQVGDRLDVRLVQVDIDRGFIDFVRVPSRS